MIITSVAGELEPLHYGNAVQCLLDSEYMTNPQYQDHPLYIDSTTGQKLTVGQYRKLIPRVAALFREKYGVKQGDVVAVFGINHIFTAAVHFGTIALGAVVSPANVMYSAPELAHQVKMTTPRLMVVFDPLVETAKKAGQDKIVTFSALFAEFMKLIANDRAPEVQPVELDGKEAPAYYCFSSGTSGVPKGVITTHFNIMSNVKQCTSFDANFITHDGTIAMVLPMSHIFALNNGVWLSTYLARTTVVFPKFDLEDFVSKVVKYRCGYMILVPPVILLLGKSDIIKKYPQFNDIVKVIISGAAPLSEEVVHLFNTKAPNVEVIQGYGLTETTPVTHLGGHPSMPADPGSIGWLVPGAEAMLVDPETGEPGRRGELWVRGPMVMKGYLNNEEATKDTMHNEWFKTGDVAEIDRHQRFRIVDRIKELIKSNGHQVAPAELEAILLNNPDILDAAVIGVYNEDKTSEMPRAYLVLEPGVDIKKTIDWFNKHVAKHKRLWGGAVQIDAIPKSATGKILRKDLRTRKGDKVVYGSGMASL